MLINNQVMDELMAQAEASSRLRMNMDLRTTPDDQSQRMLNALLPGTQLPIHRHTASTEVVVILRGRMDEIFFDEEGRETERFHLDPTTGNCALNIPLGTWHSVEVFEPTVIFESKDGAYTPLAPEDQMIIAK
ncbi:MAG: WbuC family cupin fold metalloprotein [Bacteroidales bacterium]|nr:WbuC family cupin fold metalloprotein [Bacteroidales bacterium]